MIKYLYSARVCDLSLDFELFSSIQNFMETASFLCFQMIICIDDHLIYVFLVFIPIYFVFSPFLQLHTLSLQAWPQLPTPRRRELFKYAKVSLRSQDTRWAQVPRLAVIAGITHATWNKSVQALFSTQNCDVMFTLGGKNLIQPSYISRIIPNLLSCDVQESICCLSHSNP